MPLEGTTFIGRIGLIHEEKGGNRDSETSPEAIRKGNCCSQTRTAGGSEEPYQGLREGSECV